MTAGGSRLPKADFGEKRERRTYLLALVPGVLALAVLFVYPLVGVLIRSVYKGGFTLEFYEKIIQTPIYLRVIGLSFQTAGIVTLLCAIFGYVLSYFLISVPPRIARVLLVIVLLPFFTSVIVRSYAWMVLLGRNGIVNQYLLAVGITSEPIALLYNPAGVLIGMTYVMLPFMVLTLYSVMRGIDRRLLAAAHSLGASRFQAFLRIFLPLSLPGIAGGSLLVFILSLGFFITPALMGGPKDLTIAGLIQREVEFTLNWSFASALAVVLLVITLLGFALYNRILRVERIYEARR